MYEVTIYTNIESLPEIHMKVEDLKDPQFIEITEQPYVTGVEAHKIEVLTLKK